MHVQVAPIIYRAAHLSIQHTCSFRSTTAQLQLAPICHCLRRPTQIHCIPLWLCYQVAELWWSLVLSLDSTRKPSSQLPLHHLQFCTGSPSYAMKCKPRYQWRCTTGVHTQRPSQHKVSQSWWNRVYSLLKHGQRCMWFIFTFCGPNNKKETLQDVQKGKSPLWRIDCWLNNSTITWDHLSIQQSTNFNCKHAACHMNRLITCSSKQPSAVERQVKTRLAAMNSIELCVQKRGSSKILTILVPKVNSRLLLACFRSLCSDKLVCVQIFTWKSDTRHILLP